MTPTTQDARGRPPRPAGQAVAVSKANAPWLWPAPGDRAPRWAVLLVMGLWLVTWGRSTVRAIGYLAGDYDPTEHRIDNLVTLLAGRGTETITSDLLLIPACLLLAALVLGPHRRQALTLPATRTDRHREYVAAIVWGVSMVLPIYALNPFTTSFSYTWHNPTVAQSVVDLVNASIGGAVEEVYFAVLVIVLMRRRAPWWAVVLAAAVLRGLFHVYYGPVAGGHFVWGACVAAGYLLLGKFWLPFACHAYWNAAVTATNNAAGFGAGTRPGRGWGIVANLLELGLTLAAVAAIVWCGVHLVYSPRHAAAKQPRVDTPSPPHLQDAGEDHPDPHARRTRP